MRLTRVHVDMPLTVGARLALPEAAAIHLVRVLRLTEGTDFVLFNGDGNDYPARLSSAGKRGAEADIVAVRAVANESPLRIVLVQGIARGEKMDLILQKATELGVASVVPVDSERSEVKLEGERLRKRLVHWRSVVVSACEQSGRARVPEIMPPRALAAATDGLHDGMLRLSLDPEGEHTLAMLPASLSSDIAIAIGPEGGWSPRDRETLRAAGFGGLRLGPRILRTETAGLAAIAALQSRFGDL